MTKENHSVFKQIEYFGNDETGTVKSIAAGMSHSGCVLDSGEVFLWGVIIDLQQLQTQQEKEKAVFKQPTKVAFGGSGAEKRRSQAAFEDNVLVDDIKLGEYFTLALSRKGAVYCWGSNLCGQLAQPAESKFSFSPV